MFFNMQYDSDYSIRLKMLEQMGGDVTRKYDSVYSIDLEILRLIEEGGGGSTTKEWYGTQAEYDAIAEKDENTTYFIYE